MLTPSSINISLWAFMALIGLVCSFFPAISGLWQIMAGIVIGAAFFDGLLNLRRPALSLSRKVHHNLPVSVWSKVTIKIHNNERNKERNTFSFQLHDHYSSEFKAKKQPTTITLAAGRSATIVYSIFPTRRGHYTFKGADLTVNSPLNLWQKKWFFPTVSEIKVFPNFKEISHFALLATHNHLSMIGIKKLSQKGRGNEFHQLREYRQGDELQKIDWKATSRYRRLISREYQDERDQHIIFVLDSGRRMNHEEGGKRHLDQALNSILLLAYVASRQGDSVGLYSFGGTEKWLPPRKQDNSVRALLLGMYNIESSTGSADYLRASKDLSTLQNRRSLMVIITNSRAEDHDDLLNMTRQLRRKHLVVIADLRESILDETLAIPIAGFSEAVRYQAIQHYLIRRKALLKQLQHSGVYTLDVTAGQLPVSLVNCYLDIKGSGNL